ncbi:MAG: hypothetical protein ACXIVQ_03240 [Acidimicrobiales bacterium]
MLELELTARNTAPDSPNLIHTEAARSYGFQGGIVPGLTMYAYLVRPLMDHFGIEWLENGQMETRFRRPVYDGEQITVAIEQVAGQADEVSFTMRNADGVDCVVGRAWRERDRPEVDVSSYASIPFDDAPLQDGTPELLGTHPDLKEWVLDTDAGYVADYLAQIEEDHPIFETTLHPAIVARVSAYIVGRRFNFGPRIHVGVRSRFLATAPVGTPLVGRGRIVRVWEHKGNHYLESDLLVVDENDKPIMQIDSESLFQLGDGSSNG